MKILAERDKLRAGEPLPRNTGWPWFNRGDMKQGLVWIVVLSLLAVGFAHAQTHSKTETIEYHDDTAKWVLGQVKRTTTDAIETPRTEYDPITALPIRTYSFGKLQQAPGYWAQGTHATVTDGRTKGDGGS